MILNVVMLVRDRERLTRQAIQSLYRNRTQDFFLTIVDDASERPVTDWLSNAMPTIQPVCVLRNNISNGTGAARNQGVLKARQEFGDRDTLLYLSDNDVFAQPGWDAVLIAAYKHFFPAVKIIGGGCHPFMQPRAKRDGFISGAGSLQLIYHMTYRDAISGYSWLLDWETWDRFGPLEANALGVRQGEDWAMCQRIIKAGHLVGSILPEVVLHTGVFDTFGARPPGWELMAQNQQEGIIYE